MRHCPHGRLCKRFPPNYPRISGVHRLPTSTRDFRFSTGSPCSRTCRMAMDGRSIWPLFTWMARPRLRRSATGASCSPALAIRNRATAGRAGCAGIWPGYNPCFQKLNSTSGGRQHYWALWRKTAPCAAFSSSPTFSGDWAWIIPGSASRDAARPATTTTSMWSSARRIDQPLTMFLTCRSLNGMVAPELKARHRYSRGVPAYASDMSRPSRSWRQALAP